MLHKYLQNEWMDGQTHVCLRVLESSGHGIFPVFIWDLQVPARLCLSPLDPGWLGPEGPVLGGGGQAGRERRRQRSSPRPRVRKQTCFKEPASGCTVWPHCPLVAGAENSVFLSFSRPFGPIRDRTVVESQRRWTVSVIYTQNFEYLLLKKKG